MQARPPPAASLSPAQQRSKPVGRRAAAAALLALGGLLPQRADAVDTSAISITPANPGVKEYLERRDKAMENKCPGGMFDCDGDRRDYARQQWKDFLDSGGVPKRVRDGKARSGPRSR